MTRKKETKKKTGGKEVEKMGEQKEKFGTAAELQYKGCASLLSNTFPYFKKRCSKFDDQ